MTDLNKKSDHEHDLSLKWNIQSVQVFLWKDIHASSLLGVSEHLCKWLLGVRGPVERWRARHKLPCRSHSPNGHCAWLSRFIFPCCDAGTWSSAHNRGFLITLNDRGTLTLYTEGRLDQLTLNAL